MTLTSTSAVAGGTFVALGGVGILGFLVVLWFIHC